MYRSVAMSKGNETLKNFEGMIESLAKEIMDELENDEHTGGLSWGEFKNYVEKCSDKETKLKQFLETHL